uniref:Uncharacterized protein n=1 Tax=Tetranychus urticae TaxID=32264 RepID=T1KEY5_TETUR
MNIQILCVLGLSFNLNKDHAVVCWWPKVVSTFKLIYASCYSMLKTSDGYFT